MTATTGVDRTGSAGAPAPTERSSATVGVVGAGQLAQMLHQAAVSLGIQVVTLSPDPDDAAARSGTRHLRGSALDLDALRTLASQVDVVTLDHELVPNDHLCELAASGHAVHPRPEASVFGQDKAHARAELGRLGFPIPAHRRVAEREEVARFADEHGWPVVLKARHGGYDGRGVLVVAGGDEQFPDFDAEDWIVERHVPIEVELAVLVARRPSGEQAVYPVVETLQEDGICRELVMPARIGGDVAGRARDLAGEVVEAIDATGVVAVEMFLTADGELLLNELALRPHNSGHATIEACATSQFENHLRAVLDLPLGSTTQASPAAMVNLLGGPEPVAARAVLGSMLEVPHAHPHLYGKSHRPGRKLGHVSALGSDSEEALQRARAAAQAWPRPREI